MKWKLKLGKFADIDVYIHFTFVLLLGWLGFMFWTRGNGLASMLEGIVFIILLFACVVLHEFGHALTARKYGIKTTAWLTAVFLIVAYALSLIAYFYGEFGILYLYLDIAFIIIGLVCAFLFAIRPSPQLARRLTPVFMMGEGTIICLAIILGTVYK